MSISEEPMKSMLIKMPLDLHSKLKEAAESRGVSMVSIVLDLIEGLDQQPPVPAKEVSGRPVSSFNLDKLLAWKKAVRAGYSKSFTEFCK